SGAAEPLTWVRGSSYTSSGRSRSRLAHQQPKRQRVQCEFPSTGTDLSVFVAATGGSSPAAERGLAVGGLVVAGSLLGRAFGGGGGREWRSGRGPGYRAGAAGLAASADCRRRGARTLGYR